MARGPGGQTSPATSGTFAGIYVRRIVIGLASRCTDVTSSFQRLVRTAKVLGGALRSSQNDLRPTSLASRLAMWQPSCSLTRLGGSLKLRPCQTCSSLEIEPRAAVLADQARLNDLRTMSYTTRRGMRPIFCATALAKRAGRT